MIRNLKIKFFLSLLIAVVFGLGLSFSANAQAQKVKAAFNHEAATQQPLYTEYKGVRLGMSAEETRAKLGTPAMKDSDQDFYVFSENETAQIVYDAAYKVFTISVDYLGGIGAPDYKAVVGGELEKDGKRIAIQDGALRQPGLVGIVQPHDWADDKCHCDNTEVLMAGPALK